MGTGDLVGSGPQLGGLADRYFWSRHANPRSVWAMVLAYPLLVLAIYRRSGPLLVGTLAFVVANPLLISPPDDDGAWATRVVLGERLWLEEGVWPSRDLVVAAVSAPVYLFTLTSAVRRRPVWTILGTAVSLIAMFGFFDRMAQRYGASERR